MPPGGTKPEKQSAAWPEARQGEIRTASLSPPETPGLCPQNKPAQPTAAAIFLRKTKQSCTLATRRAKRKADWPLKKGFCASPNAKHNHGHHFSAAEYHTSVQRALLKHKILLTNFWNELSATIPYLGNLCSFSWENHAFWEKELLKPCP